MRKNRFFLVKKKVRFDCMVDEALRDRANLRRKKPWPQLIEEKFREIETGFDLMKLERACLKALATFEYLAKTKSKDVPDAARQAHELRLALGYTKERKVLDLEEKLADEEKILRKERELEE